MDSENKNIYQKLLEVKKQVPYLKKDGAGYQFMYATPSQVLGTFNPLLNDVGVILKTEVIKATHERIFVKNKKDKEKTTHGKPQKKDVDGDVIDSGQKAKDAFIEVYETLYNLEMRFTWVDTATGETDVNLFFASGMNGDDKGVGSAMTYAERYFFLKYFNVPTDSDDPDSFQEKYLSDDQKELLQKEREAKLIEEQETALKESPTGKLLEASKTVDELGKAFKILSEEDQKKFSKLVTVFKLELKNK